MTTARYDSAKERLVLLVKQNKRTVFVIFAVVMDLSDKKCIPKYDRVMSRLYNLSRTNLNPRSYVTRHEIPSSASLGAKPSSSNVNSVYSDLPVVLHDYSPEVPVKRTFVVKPRKTVKSLDPATSPHRMASKVEVRPIKRPSDHKVGSVRAGGSAPVVANSVKDRWSDSHVRQCFSSRSHTRLMELKVQNCFNMNILNVKLV